MALPAFSPGCFARILHAKIVTSLVRMDPGARYPRQCHLAIEELFLFSGDLHVEGQIMHTGDYCLADSGTIHGGDFY
jgi:ChrR-like protein with cupin domain